jgi:hypothetical protein
VGRYDDAINAVRRADGLGQLGMAHGLMSSIFASKGDEVHAFEWFLKYENEKQLKPDPKDAEKLRSIFRVKGWKGITERQLETERANPIYVKGRFYRFARFSAELGDFDDAFMYLNKAMERRESQLLWLKYDPSFEPLRSDRRYEELLRRIGFPV